jgi:hypothetical protein
VPQIGNAPLQAALASQVWGCPEGPCTAPAPLIRNNLSRGAGARLLAQLLSCRSSEQRSYGRRWLAMPKQQPNGTPGKPPAGQAAFHCSGYGGAAASAKALGIGRASVYRVLGSANG